MSKLKIVSLILFFASSLSFAEGMDLLEACKATKEHVSGGKQSEPSQSGLCIGLLNGVYDSLRLKSKLAADKEICLPKEKISLSDGLDMIISYLESSDHNIKMDNPQLVVLAFQSKYPCKNT